jgi:[ribosomal protein S5]-alanine N-acetyltransferase
MGFPVLRTQRLVLRPWTPEDVDSLHTLFTAPEVRRYLWDDVVIWRELVAQLVDSHLATVDHHGIGYWTLHLATTSTADGAIAGFCGFRFINDGPEIELMYGLRAEQWGKGLATEACWAAVEHLWNSTGFRRVYARTDPPNENSVRVMQRLGMMRESSTESTTTYVLQRQV